MQSAVARGPGAALGVVAIVMATVATWRVTRAASRSGGVPVRA